MDPGGELVNAGDTCFAVFASHGLGEDFCEMLVAVAATRAEADVFASQVLEVTETIYFSDGVGFSYNSYDRSRVEVVPFGVLEDKSIERTWTMSSAEGLATGQFDHPFRTVRVGS